ncbi:hypothetical protein DL96DRAFT_1719589 [Flagelloscypha sp. PMI_526]|nr:hypothetical protein DL96DRAFT_1719589 [Flagelloscypha sp. PMI_526]
MDVKDFNNRLVNAFIEEFTHEQTQGSLLTLVLTTACALPTSVPSAPLLYYPKLRESNTLFEDVNVYTLFAAADFGDLC